ncbi:MAG: alpha-ribazole phosphatase [Bacteroidota bacterium]|nr:alpha-ribazole phosphatase [Bacteroidota bacterium]
MQLTLIRHTSVAVASGICYGRSDVDVAGTFEAEASLVLSKLQQISFDAVYSSPLLRCRKLAGFCGFPDPVIDNRLMELNFGAWEMKAWADIKDPQLQCWFDDWVYEIPTRGESFKSMTDRVEEFLKEIRELPLQQVAVFTHAGVIRSAGIITGRFNAAQAFDYRVDYGDLMEISLY